MLDANDPRTEHILNYYSQESAKPYISQLIDCLKGSVISENKEGVIFNIIKTPRAGCTTNSIIAALIYDKPIVIIEPTNAIADKTVMETLKLYEEITKDTSKKVRKIPRNDVGCSIIKERMAENENLEKLPFIKTGSCKECSRFPFPLMQKEIPESNLNHCMIKTMMNEREKYPNRVPDIITITYSKLDLLLGGEKNEFFEELLQSAQIMFFDEIGDYLTKASNGIPIKTTDEIYSATNKCTFDPSNAKFYKNFFDLTLKNETVQDIKKKVLDTIIKMPSKQSRMRLMKLFSEYIDVFVNDYCVYMEEMFADGREHPFTKNNVLMNDFVKIKVNGRFMELSKADAIGQKLYEEIDDIVAIYEDANGDEETQESIVWLLNIIQMMSSKVLIGYKSEGILPITAERDGFDSRNLMMKRTSINIAPCAEEVLGKLKKWTVGKCVFVTDATMPSIYLKQLGDVVDLYFGDPAKTNSSVVYMYDDNMGRMSVIKWDKDFDFRNAIYDKIFELSKGREDDVVIWCPNKRIYNDVKLHLKINDVKTSEYNDEIQDGIVVSYYGSSFARGMKCNRRIGIALGKASKPMQSFDHVVYQYRSSYRPFRKREMQNIAKKSGIKYDKFIKRIQKWENVIYKGDVMFHENGVPEELHEYFRLCSLALRSERIDMDTFQALNRTKDPMGNIRSVVVCLGWNENDVESVLKWGSVDSVCHARIGGNMQRLVDRQNSIISPPQIVEYNKMDELDAWIGKGKLDCKYVGFNNELMNTIRLLAIQWKPVLTSEEIWMNVSKNMKVSELHEDFHNGYFVGSVRACMKYDDVEDMSIQEISEGKFIFHPLSNIQRVTSTTKFDTLYNITELLKVVYGIFVYNNVADFHDIRDNLRGRMDEKTIHDTCMIINEHNFLHGSTWKCIVTPTKRKQYDGRETKGFHIEFRKFKKIIKNEEKKPFDIVYNHVSGWERMDMDDMFHINEFIHEIRQYKHNIDKRTIVSNLLKIFPKENNYENNILNCKLVVDPTGKPLYLMRTKIRLKEYKMPKIRVL